MCLTRAPLTFDIRNTPSNLGFILFFIDSIFHIFVLALAEIAKVQQSGRIPQREQKYVDIYREKQIRVTVKVLVPVKEHPKVSYELKCRR